MDAEMICDRCGEEIYSGESHYFLNGQAVCIDCAGDFALELLAPYRVGGAAWPRM